MGSPEVIVTIGSEPQVSRSDQVTPLKLTLRRPRSLSQSRCEATARPGPGAQLPRRHLYGDS
jgi:hypothetical protein